MAVTEVFSPVDEAAHFAYVQSMGHHLRPPVVGEDRLRPDTLELVKRARTSYWRGMPVPPSPGDDRWGSAAQSYEGVQGPLYYLLMAGPYRVARPFGLLTSLYAVRIASVVLALLAVPIAYALARHLFPRRPEGWLGAPALLVVLQGFNGNLAAVTNDALVVPLAAGALLTFCRSARRRFDAGGGALTGVLVGLGLATKANMVSLVPIIGAAAVAAALVRRTPFGRLVQWVVLAGVTAAGAVAPWVVWNLARYGRLSASEEVDAITGPFQSELPFSVESVRQHLVGATSGFWDHQLVGSRLGRYMASVTIGAALLLVAGVVASRVRGQGRDARVMAWLGGAWFLTAGTMLAVIYGVFDGRSSTAGRHMYPALVAVVVAVAVGAFAAARRYGGWLALAVLANVALSAEPAMVDRMVRLTYANNVIGNLTPVVDQSWGEREVAAFALDLDPPCRAEAFGVGLRGEPPAALPVATTAGLESAPFLGLQGTPAQRIAVYHLRTPLSGPFSVRLGGALVSAAAGERDPDVSLSGEEGDPVARIFCPSDDPEEARFQQQFDPDHASWITYHQVKAWPRAWQWAGVAGLATVAAAAASERLRRRRRRPQGEFILADPLSPPVPSPPLHGS